MGYIEGARKRPFLLAGAPVGTEFAGEADKGDLLSDTVNGELYINTGTLAVPVWTLVGSQVV